MNSTFKFLNQITGAPVDSLLWTFGDGTTSASTDATVYHTYTSSGDFTSSLSATSIYEQYGDKTRVVSISSTPAPTASFYADETFVWALDPVVFTNDSTGSVTSVLWDFGAGAIPETSTSDTTVIVHFPSKLLQHLSSYTIALTAIGPGGVDTETKVDYMTIHAFAPPPSE